jgi:hypothetical protein
MNGGPYSDDSREHVVAAIEAGHTREEAALLRSFGEQSPLFSKGFPKENAKLISQTQDTPNLIEKCSRPVK